MNKKGTLSKVSLKSWGFGIVALGGMYAAITTDFRIGGIIIAVGGMIVAAGDLL